MHVEQEIILRTYDLMNVDEGRMITRGHRLTVYEATEKNYALQLNNTNLKYVLRDKQSSLAQE